MPIYAVPREQLLEALRYDCETFLGFYLGEELELGVPEFHKEVWEEFLVLLEHVNSPEHVNGILNKLLAVPREHAKTTLTKLAVLLFLRYSKLSFCAYTSNTFGVALNAIRDVKDWFLSSQDTELYGPTAKVKTSESEGLYILDIPVPGRSKPKRIIMKAFGQGTQIRGTIINNQRPDILIFDDIESKETADSPAQQKKLDDWCFGTALKSMARRGVCIFIGNMIADTTLLARLSSDKTWNPTVLGSIVQLADGETTPLWPGRWSLDALLEDYAKYRRIGLGHTWEAEMMNLTSDEVFGQSLASAIRPPRPAPDELEAGFICLDPAFGLNKWNDESALTVHVRKRGADIPMVVESNKDRWREEDVFDEMLRMSLYWGIKTWVIESVAAQRLLIPLFHSYIAQRKLGMNVITMLPVYSGKDSKASRIVAFRDSVAKGSYGIVDTEQGLLDKLEVYSPLAKDHDDLCDSAAYGTVIWAQYGSIIQANGITHVAGALFSAGSNEASVSQLAMGIP